METLKLSADNIETCAKRAAGILRAGGLVIYPTDTVYGLGADAFSDEAVAKIYTVKARDESKPVHCVVASLDMAAEYGELNDTARALAKKFLPGPLTLVVEKKTGISSGIAQGIETIGFRIPKDDFCIALAHEFGRPYTTTSANVSGMETGKTPQAVLEQLGDKAVLVDLVIDAGELPRSKPSTVVGVHGKEVVVLREGAIPTAKLGLTQ